mmetsp:Transcript_139459/g.197432  ORF Transcript_139459/g.197432 Transcript_139459/m.197432 type:complete len:104 (-) Transcript_139459:890-1201(-)
MTSTKLHEPVVPIAAECCAENASVHGRALENFDCSGKGKVLSKRIESLVALKQSLQAASNHQRLIPRVNTSASSRQRGTCTGGDNRNRSHTHGGKSLMPPPSL